MFALVFLTPNQRRYFFRALFSSKQLLFNLLVFGLAIARYAWRFPQWIQLQADGTLVIVSYWRKWVFHSIESVRPNANLCWIGCRHIRTDFATGFKNRVLVKFSSLSSSTLVLVSPEDLEGFLEVANRLSSCNHSVAEACTTTTSHNDVETNFESLEAGMEAGMYCDGSRY